MEMETVFTAQTRSTAAKLNTSNDRIRNRESKPLYFHRTNQQTSRKGLHRVRAMQMQTEESDGTWSPALDEYEGEPMIFELEL
jgi:hypothetical protein